jgi:hypothetical protein
MSFLEVILNTRELRLHGTLCAILFITIVASLTFSIASYSSTAYTPSDHCDYRGSKV